MARSRTPKRAPRKPAQPEAAGEPPRLWAPWRGAYLRAVAKPGRGCIFCFGTLGAREHRRRLVLYAGPLALVMAMPSVLVCPGSASVAAASLVPVTRVLTLDAFETPRDRLNTAS